MSTTETLDMIEQAKVFYEFAAQQCFKANKSVDIPLLMAAFAKHKSDAALEAAAQKCDDAGCPECAAAIREMKGEKP